MEEFDETLINIGKNLKAKRKKLMYSQEEVSRRTDIPRIYISKIENGNLKEVKFKVLFKLCNFYSVKLSEVLDEINF
ncbi:TPA: helix-turn-helix transcriptional regulator [Staphylococcus aureus]|nr:helix-turn-helix transcriptional regulator [Staphylococcus aureus]